MMAARLTIAARRRRTIGFLGVALAGRRDDDGVTAAVTGMMAVILSGAPACAGRGGVVWGRCSMNTRRAAGFLLRQGLAGAAGWAVCWSVCPAAVAKGAPKETVLLAFDGKDGAQPQSSLLADGAGSFYGTTSIGGTQNAGTVFSLSPPKTGQTAWTEKLLFDFPGSASAFPTSGLIADSKGDLYGTTSGGGTGNAGTVFKLTAHKGAAKGLKQTILANFGDNTTGAPIGTLIADGAGNLYGVTAAGGANFYGTVYEVSPPPKGQTVWTFTVLYAFAATDGYPAGGLILDSAGNLYGLSGGESPNSTGTVYEVSPPLGGQGSWTETVLFAFTGTDGSAPLGGLTLDSAGNLYGTTAGNGVSSFGTAFEVSPPAQGQTVWTETTLFNFTASLGQSNGSLIRDAAGNLFGTSINGGKSQCGSVFELSPPKTDQMDWTGSVLVSFTGKQGAQPVAGLAADAAGNLYGTTEYGGAADRCASELAGDGTVFEVTLK
jgi:uncharacterized repeat protein (TIGR03803 family)